MKRFLLALVVVIAACGGLSAPAHARGYIGIGIGGGYYGGGYYGRPYYDPYYNPYYGYPAYYGPPPTVVYTQPAPATYIVQQPAQPPYQQPYQPAAQTMPGPVPEGQQTDLAPPPDGAPMAPVAEGDETFTDKKGRTCRRFETDIDGSAVKGTACQRKDGSWHSVEE